MVSTWPRHLPGLLGLAQGLDDGLDPGDVFIAGRHRRSDHGEIAASPQWPWPAADAGNDVRQCRAQPRAT